ncbi:MAG: alginate lyase family protein, partial [Clostridia bacterium]|nr:alginate lyase family protein [Clostridia bacterium]
RPLLFSRTREAAWLRRACAQVEKDGRQPQELARTNSFGYSLMNLTGLCLIGQMGRLRPTRPDFGRAGVDFFRAERDGYNPLLAAADFLAPYALGGEPWPYEQIGAAPEAPARVWPYALIAAALPDAPYAKDLPRLYTPEMLFRLLPL